MQIEITPEFLKEQGFSDTIVERFWAKVQKTDTCWNWIGCRDKKSYGQINIGIQGKHIKTHRLSWIIHNGPIPDGLNVLHHCDNPPCIHPDHLFLGTNKDNTQDMMQKGRNNGWKKLNSEQVEVMRNMWKSGKFTQPELAKLFGVGTGNVWHIINGRSWKSIMHPVTSTA